MDIPVSVFRQTSEAREATPQSRARRPFSTESQQRGYEQKPSRCQELTD